jgi:hypothetical protein
MGKFEYGMENGKAECGMGNAECGISKLDSSKQIEFLVGCNRRNDSATSELSPPPATCAGGG